MKFLSALLLLSAPAAATGQTFAELYDAVVKDTATLQVSPDSCVRLNHVWKRQIVAVFETRDSAPEYRQSRLLELAYRPFARFWSGYVGNDSAFVRMSQRRDLATDGRNNLPVRADVAALVLDATRRDFEASGYRACADWYLVFGSGVANLGGLSGRMMLIDFFGVPPTNAVENIRLTLPHEMNHISFGRGHAADPDAGNLLSSIIAEGFASWYADLYWGAEVSAAAALGYSEAEWIWALEHERLLWQAAEPLLKSRDRSVHDRFRAARARIVPEGPGKAGYFLGYRIVDAYVKRHGDDSWRRLFTLPVAQILRESGYSPGR